MSKKSKPTKKPKGRKAPIDHATQHLQATKIQQNPIIPNSNPQKQNTTQQKPIKQRDLDIKEEETIKISSDEDETTTTDVTVKNAADKRVGSDLATFSKSSKTRSCSSPSRSSSTLSSPISSSYRSPDYEAEADEEDANECENIMKLQRKLSGGNANLMHVQNFLSYFDEQQQKPNSTAIICTTAQSQNNMLQQREEHAMMMQCQVLGRESEINLLTNYVAQHAADEFLTPQQAEVIGIPKVETHIQSATITTTAEVETSASNAKVTTKPNKFTISTKFLRKPRHKLKSVNLAQSAQTKNVMAARTTTTSDNDKLITMPEQQNQQQQHDNNHVLQQMQQQQQQKQQPRQQPPNDEPNVKFNSNFSINSLLNKK